MKFLNFIWKKIENIFENDFLVLMQITLLNFIPYGINKYFFSKYATRPFYYKTLKFLIGYIEFFIFCLGIMIILSLFKEKIKNIILNTIKYLSYFTFIIEILLLKNFDALMNAGFFQVLLETNQEEGIEFLKMYFNFKIVILIIFLVVLNYLVIKIFNRKIDINRFFKIKSFKIIFIIYIIYSIFDFKGREIFPFERFYNSPKEAYKNVNEYKNIGEKFKNNELTIVSNNSKIKNIILVIGESTTRNHMSLYDYPLETNQLLKKLDEKNLYKFTDIISPHSHTIPVIKKLLTFYNLESEKEWYKYNNLIDIMKKSGYKTYWFSNQETSGIYGNVAVALGRQSDKVLFNTYKDSQTEVTSAYDEQIIDKSIEKIKKENKNFIIYHLMGTHGSYKHRYPKEFNVFQTKSEKMIGEYDNAVLYNDYVINKIISNFKDEDSIILYVSDHGEEVYDFRDFAGHAETNISRYMVEIPFLIYTSDKFIENYPEKVESIKNSLNKPYMTDDLIHTILDIADIKTSEFDETRSIINKNFNDKRKRITGGKDYDTELKNKN